jgi:hypothetical protein
MENPNQNATPVALNRLVRLPVGETIRRGDKFLSGDGRYLEMDNLGRMLGVRCLGQVLKKEGAWFREPNSFIEPPAAFAGEEQHNQAKP